VLGLRWNGPDALSLTFSRASGELAQIVLYRLPRTLRAAIESKSCELTVLGQHYWKLVHDRLI